MIRRKMLVVLTVVALGTGLALSPAADAKKKCLKLCKVEIKACKTACVAPKKKKCVLKCPRTVLMLCKSRPEKADSCSPSGAFIDALD